jgi:hypothetical protein
MRGKLGRFAMFVAALVALAPAAANAQSNDGNGNLMTRYSGYFLAGGGVTDYFSQAVKDQLGTGGSWDLRLGFGNRSYLGAELAYVGSARKAGSLGSDLFTNGAEAVMRVQYPWSDGEWLVEPFAFGGVGWTHFQITDATTAAMASSDDVFVMPVGGGVTLGYDHLLLDTRFTYRHTFDAKLIRDADGSAAEMNSWAITAAIGYRF